MKPTAMPGESLLRFGFALILGFLLAAGGAFAQAPAQPSPAQQQAERQHTQPLNNAPFWREVRKEAQPYFTSIPGRETNVLIQSFGETWRQIRNGPVTFWGGWLLVVVIIAIGLFYWWKGPVGLKEPPTGRLIERFSSLERISHWSMAISFCFLAVTGLIILFGKHVLLPVFGYTLFAWLTQLSKYIHNFVGPLFIFSIIVGIIVFIRNNWLKGYDFKWLASLGGMVSGKHVPAGKLNAGQKLWFWLGVVLLGILMSASGLILDFPNFDQTRSVMIQADMVHAIAGILFMAAGLGHIYLGTIGFKGAYDAMRHGYVDETWAKEHHEYWYNDVKSGKVRTESASGTPGAPQVQH